MSTAESGETVLGKDLPAIQTAGKQDLPDLFSPSGPRSGGASAPEGRR
jgi:hypothetical protein